MSYSWDPPSPQKPTFSRVFTGSEIAATGQFPGRSAHSLGVYYWWKHKELDVFTAEKVRVFLRLKVI
jgi:hypothetical protein